MAISCARPVPLSTWSPAWVATPSTLVEPGKNLGRDWMGKGLTFKMTMTNRSVTTSGRLATNCESLAWSEVVRMPRRRKYENEPGTISKAISSLFLREQWWWNVLSYNVSLLTHSSSVILYLLLFLYTFFLFAQFRHYYFNLFASLCTLLWCSAFILDVFFVLLVTLLSSIHLFFPCHSVSMLPVLGNTLKTPNGKMSDFSKNLLVL